MPRRYLVQRLRLHQLRAVDALDSQRSVIKAAALLGISQPALTRTLHDIEQIAGLRLFDRHARGIRPTAAGLACAEAARRVLAELRSLDDTLDRIADPTAGTLALGALPVAAAGVLPGVLARLKTTHPALRIRLEQGRTEELLPLLAGAEIDLVVGRLYAPAAADGFIREPLWTEPLSLIARPGHPILDAPQPITPAILAAHDLVLPTVTQRVGQEIDALLHSLGLDPAAALRSSSYNFIREMLFETDAVALMPRLMMLGDLLRGSLRLLPLPIETPPRPAGLIRAPGRTLPPPAEAFAAELRAYVTHVESITGRYESGPRNDAPKRVRRR